MPISRFSEVAEELQNLSKEIERLQKQLNEEREQRLRMEQAFSERLQEIQQALDSLNGNK
jgi:predicted  nucleic acid-binding Zn-ribbon protein